jgi:hypothetical protein
LSFLINLVFVINQSVPAAKLGAKYPPTLQKIKKYYALVKKKMKLFFYKKVFMMNSAEYFSISNIFEGK